jgi:translation initiation factor IF-1
VICEVYGKLSEVLPEGLSKGDCENTTQFSRYNFSHNRRANIIGKMRGHRTLIFFGNTGICSIIRAANLFSLVIAVFNKCNFGIYEAMTLVNIQCSGGYWKKM